MYIELEEKRKMFNMPNEEPTLLLGKVSDESIGFGNPIMNIRHTYFSVACGKKKNRNFIHNILQKLHQKESINDLNHFCYPISKSSSIMVWYW